MLKRLVVEARKLMEVKAPSIFQAQRQQHRKGGQYSKMPPCDACGKRAAVEPGYTTSEGGQLPDDSKWAGLYVCKACIKKERKRAGLKSEAVEGADEGPFLSNLRGASLQHSDFRRVVYTGEKTQFALMHLPPGGDIGEETHQSVEQVFFCTVGAGKTTFDGITLPFEEGDVLVVPPGTKHNIENTGEKPLKFYTSYSPPNHLPDTVHKTKADADADDADEKFGQKVAKEKP